MLNCQKFLNIILISFLIVGCDAKSRQKDRSDVSKPGQVTVPAFNADSAYAYMQRQVDFGYRIPNTPAHEKTAVYLADVLRRHGADVMVQEAELTAYDGTVLHAKNIIGSYNKENPERILLFAHWDTRPYADNDRNAANHRKPIEGANDGASGVGVLLEIARHLAATPANVGIDIIFFDAEDYGEPYFYQGRSMDDSWALGSQYWSKNPHVEGYTARYGILLDMVGARNAVFPKEQISMRYAPSVVDKVWNTAKSLGYGRFFDEGAGGYITDDHVYVNKMGIPSIDIIDYDKDSESFNPQWHTLDDTMQFIDPATLKAVGQTVLHVIYSE